MTRKSTPGVRQRHTRKCTRPASCRCPWEWLYEGARDEATGQRTQASRSGFPTKREALSGRAKYIAEGEHRTSARRKMTVEMWLTEWLDGRIAGNGKPLKASTIASYRDHVDRLLVPRLGRRPLTELKPADIERCFTSIRKDYPRLSRASQGRVFATLRTALNTAVKQGLITSNPCNRTSLSSSVKAPKVRPWTAEELAMFLSSALTQEHRLFPALLLASATGLRRGEVCGLRWSDLDLTEGLVRPVRSRTVVDHVVHEDTVKSESGQDRSVGLDPVTVAVLTEWRSAQQLERWHWSDEHRGESDPYVFTEPTGEPIDPEKVTRTFYALTRAAGLRQVRLHDLRHGAASLMLRANVPLLAVSKLLGHSSITISADLYSHLDVRQGQAAVNAAAALVRWTRTAEA